MAAYDRGKLIAATRSMIQNIPTGLVSPDNMNQLAQQAKRKLDRDRPRRVTATIAGDDGKYYDLSVLTGWVRGTSFIRDVQNPEPIVANDEFPRWDGNKSWRQIDLSGVEYLFVLAGVSASKNVLVEYELPWSVIGIDEAVATDLDVRFENALEFLLTALTCLSLASKASGTTDNQVAADFINFGSKEGEYRRTGREWMIKYEEELNISGENPAAIFASSDYDHRTQHGLGYVTHPVN